MYLVNGRGQLGEVLKNLKYDSDIIIYHTWNFIDKSENVQHEEFNKVRNFLEKSSKEKKIIFISTLKTEDSSYLLYKREAEKLILLHSPDNLGIRLPCLIGKGVFAGLRDNIIQPFGNINFISISEAYDFISKSLRCRGIIESHYWTVSAKTIKELMEFSKQ